MERGGVPLDNKVGAGGKRGERMLPASIGMDVHKLTGHQVQRDGGSHIPVGDNLERFLVGQDLLKPGKEGGVQDLRFSPEISRMVWCSSVDGLKRKDSIREELFPQSSS